MTIGTDTAEEEMNTANIFDLLLITCTLGSEVGSITVEDIDVLFADVDMREEVIPHEAVIALRMLFGQVDILVHIESDYIAEGNLAGLVQFDQFAVHTEGRRAGRQTQYKRLALFGIKLNNTFCYIVRSPLTEQVIRRFDDYSHCYFKFMISNL